jgi:hypothetical protein
MKQMFAVKAVRRIQKYFMLAQKAWIGEQKILTFVKMLRKKSINF